MEKNMENEVDTTSESFAFRAKAYGLSGQGSVGNTPMPLGN